MILWVTRQSWETEPGPAAERSSPCEGARLGFRDGEQAWFVDVADLEELRQFINGRLMPVSFESGIDGEMQAEIRDCY